MKLQVVVHRHVGRPLSRHEGGAHIHDNCRGSIRAQSHCAFWRERSRVGNRLDRRAGLARRERDVHRAVNSRVEVVGTAEHDQHFARARVKGEERGVMYIVVWFAIFLLS